MTFPDRFRRHLKRPINRWRVSILDLELGIHLLKILSDLHIKPHVVLFFPPLPRIVPLFLLFDLFKECVPIFFRLPLLEFIGAHRCLKWVIRVIRLSSSYDVSVSIPHWSTGTPAGAEGSEETVVHWLGLYDTTLVLVRCEIAAPVRAISYRSGYLLCWVEWVIHIAVTLLPLWSQVNVAILILIVVHI